MNTNTSGVETEDRQLNGAHKAGLNSRDLNEFPFEIMRTSNLRIRPREGVKFRVLAALALSGLLLAPATPVYAQLTFTINPNSLHGRPGDTLSFGATLSNLGADELFLNGDSFTLFGDGLTVDDTPFLSNFPLSLPGGGSAAGELFTVNISPDAMVGGYNGSFTFLGGATDGDFEELATQRFSVSVSVPEPATVSLIVLGGAALGFVCRQQRRAVVAARRRGA